jgi:hypothetical protein
VRVKARHDAALAAEFAAPPAAESAKPAPAAAKPADPAAAKSVDPERLTARATGVEYEIPVYKYEAIFKPQEELLEKVEPAAVKKPAAKK